MSLSVRPLHAIPPSILRIVSVRVSGSAFAFTLLSKFGRNANVGSGSESAVSTRSHLSHQRRAKDRKMSFAGDTRRKRPKFAIPADCDKVSHNATARATNFLFDIAATS
eukprot:802357-Rhodomonas_salina.1